MGKYREKNESCNTKCNTCKNPIWVRGGVYTCYDGYQHWASYPSDYPESVTLLTVGANKVTNVCWPCYKKEHDVRDKL